MGQIDFVKEDLALITSDLDGFAKQIIFTAPTGQTATLNGIHSKHHMGFDIESGRNINTKNAHISVSESFLVAQSYPLRGLDGKVNLKDHQVQVRDSTGTLAKYVVAEWMPDETIGLILCILGDKK